MLSMTKDVEILQAVTSVGVGAAWKTSGGGQKGLLGRLKKAIGTDLDLVAVAMSDGSPKRICWFDNQDAFDDGSLASHGDSRTGKGAGDDEFIQANLDRIPQGIDSIVFIVVAYKEGVTFDKVEGITLNVYDMSHGQIKIGDYMPDIDSRGNATVIAKVVRQGLGWGLQIVNEMGNARSRNQLLELAKRYS